MAATTWNVDPTHSAINFSVRHMMFAKVRGRFGNWTAKLQLDDADLTNSSVEVEIDVASIDTGVGDRDNHLRSSDFFDAGTHPKITFKSSKVEKTGEGRYAAHGQLTIRDVTRDIVLDVEHGGFGKDPWGNRRAGFMAKAHVDRGDYGLKWNQVLEAGGVLVGERIDIEIEIQALAPSA
jgi:polyisoprenoid-binding protein YceI